MDFRPTDDQQAVVDLATRIVADHTAPDDLRTLEGSGTVHHAALWHALVDADLVGLALPEASGGGGYGLVEATMLAEILGEHVAPVPYVETIAAGRALAAAGHDRARAVGGGEIVVPALREGVETGETTTPMVEAAGEAGSVRLTGEKRLVSGATQATAYLVSARRGQDVGLYLVEAGDVDGTIDSETTAGQVLRSIRLADTPAEALATGEGSVALTRLLHELRVLRSAHLGGIAQGALDLTAAHCKEREQFGSPIGTFQAVAHRMADSWLDVNMIRATSRQAAWRTDNELPYDQAAASAALWACEGVQRVVHAAQHVHGGIGVDLDYPVHRYFRWAKDVELQLGGPSTNARLLGASIAAEPLTIG